MKRNDGRGHRLSLLLTDHAIAYRLAIDQVSSCRQQRLRHVPLRFRSSPFELFCDLRFFPLDSPVAFACDAASLSSGWSALVSSIGPDTWSGRTTAASVTGGGVLIPRSVHSRSLALRAEVGDSDGSSAANESSVVLDATAQLIRRPASLRRLRADCRVGDRRGNAPGRLPFRLRASHCRRSGGYHAP